MNCRIEIIVKRSWWVPFFMITMESGCKLFMGSPDWNRIDRFLYRYGTKRELSIRPR